MAADTAQEPEGAKAAWDRVGDLFNDLGSRFKEQFDARVAFGEAPDRERLEAAVRTLVDALEGAFRAAADTLSDPRVSDEVKKAVDAVGSAIGTSFEVAGQQIRRVFGTGRPGGPGGAGGTGSGGGGEQTPAE